MSAPPNTKKVGRLTMRVEGDWWVARYAETATMEGAVELGRVHMGTVQIEERKDAFMALMQAVVADIIEGAVGERPSWTGARPAPEHERSGSA